MGPAEAPTSLPSQEGDHLPHGAGFRAGKPVKFDIRSLGGSKPFCLGLQVLHGVAAWLSSFLVCIGPALSWLSALQFASRPQRSLQMLRSLVACQRPGANFGAAPCGLSSF